MLVCPGKDFLKVPTLMNSAHSIDAHLCQRLKGCVGMAYQCLSDVVEAVVSVEGNLVRRVIDHGFWVVGKAKEVLQWLDSLDMSIGRHRILKIDSQDSEADEIPRLHTQALCQDCLAQAMKPGDSSPTR